MTGLASATDSQAVTVHFGNDDFTGKYRMLVDNFAQWQANAGACSPSTCSIRGRWS